MRPDSSMWVFGANTSPSRKARHEIRSVATQKTLKRVNTGIMSPCTNQMCIVRAVPAAVTRQHQKLSAIAQPLRNSRPAYEPRACLPH